MILLFVELCVPRIWLCLFMLRPIRLTQINTFISCLGGLNVKHQTAARQNPASIFGSGKIFLSVIFF